VCEKGCFYIIIYTVGPSGGTSKTYLIENFDSPIFFRFSFVSNRGAAG
jgi:hypothetical protein